MRNTLFIVLLTMVSPICSSQTYPFGTSPAKSTIVIRAINGTAKQGSKITVAVKETFVSDGFFLATVGHPFKDEYDIDVRWADGGTVSQTELGRKMSEARMGNLSGIVGPAKAGTTRTNEIVVSDQYDMSQPGIYKIQVKRRDVKSNTITVKVVP